MNALLDLLRRCDAVISRVTRLICIASMMIIFVMFLANVFVRFVPIYNFKETDEWTQLFLVWVIFFGAQELVRTRSHFVVDVLTDRMAGTALGRQCRVIVTIIEFIMYLAICWYGFVLVSRAQSYMLAITWMQKRWFYLVIPVSAFFMSCYALRDIVQAFIALKKGDAPAKAEPPAATTAS